MQAQRLRHWMAQRVTKPLLVGLLCSLVLHLGVLLSIGGLPGWERSPAQPALLQARLLPPPSPPVAQPAPAVATPSVAPSPNKVPSPSKAPRPLPPPATIPEVTPTDTVTAVTETPQAAPPVVDEAAEAAATQAAAFAAWHQPTPPTPSEEETAAPPYQHVSTTFDLFINGQTSPAGSASIEYQRESPDTYQLQWKVQGRGLLKLLYPSLEQVSRGSVTLTGLKPAFYRYAFGQRADKTYEATFDWAQSSLTLKTSKGEQQLALPANTQDLLSFMYQFMFIPPLQEMRVTLTNGRRLGEYEYVFEGEDTLTIADRSVATVHIAHTRGGTDEKIDLWLASEYRYVPVKIKKLEKNGMVIEQVATRLIAD